MEFIAKNKSVGKHLQKSEIQKPYIQVVKNKDFIEIEIIDGFAKGLIELSKKSLKIENHSVYLNLERIQSSTFNCYYSENLQIQNEKINLINIFIEENNNVLFETIIKL